jgi:hypothetical protein
MADEVITDIVISYARIDIDWANDFRAALEEDGRHSPSGPWRIFFDVETLKVTDYWRSRIIDTVHACRCFVAVLSPAYMESYAERRMCFHEYETAIHRELEGNPGVVLQVLHRDAKLASITMVRKQLCDLRGVSGNDLRQNQRYRNLVDEINQLVGTSRPVTAPSIPASGEATAAVPPIPPSGQATVAAPSLPASDEPTPTGARTSGSSPATPPSILASSEATAAAPPIPLSGEVTTPAPPVPRSGEAMGPAPSISASDGATRTGVRSSRWRPGVAMLVVAALFSITFVVARTSNPRPQGPPALANPGPPLTEKAPEDAGDVSEDVGEPDALAATRVDASVTDLAARPPTKKHRARPTEDLKRMYREGERQMHLERFPEARKIFENLATQKAVRGPALLGLAEVSFQERNYKQAVSEAELAAKSGGGVRALILLGDAHFRLNQFTQAARAYRAALQADPQNASAKSGLALSEKRLP